MNKRIIETFKKEVMLNAVRVSYYQGNHDESDLLNILTLQVIKSAQKVEYRFNEVLEYNQKTTTIKTNELFIDTSNNWFIDYIANFKEGYQRTFDENEDDIKITADLDFYHFVFIIDGHCFNILCKEYFFDDNGFNQSYRDDEKMKKIIS